MEGYNSKVGKGVLKICMGDNYTDVTVVFREYVQNAIDAIYTAESLGLLSNTDNYVSIDVDPVCVKIMDRGVGVKSSDIGPVLVDLGNSTKTNSDIGQYGIGRLSGANWCDKIIFETSYSGESVRSILTFDAKLARALIQETEVSECSDVMDRVTSFKSEPEDANEHYFRVTLENVKEELCDVEKVSDYLSFIAPVPYDDTFEDDCLKKAFNAHPEYKELLSKEKLCKIHLNGKPIVKPYSSSIYIDSKPLKITPPAFFTLRDEDYGNLAWGWYSINEEARQMGEAVSYKGLRLRAKNMAVGPQDYLISSFKNATDANYIVGEVFIIHENIQPTGSRDGMKASPEYAEFKIRLKDKCKEISSVYNAMSKLGSAALNPFIKAKTNINELRSANFLPEDQEEVKGKIKEQKELIQNAKSEIASKIKTIDAAENAELIKQSIIKHWTKEAQRQASEVNAKAKPNEKIEAANVESFINDAIQEGVPSNSTQKPESDVKVSTEKDKNSIQTEPKETDVFRKLGKAEYNLIKKVYQVLNGEKRLDEKTKEKIKSKLVKRILAE